MPALLLAATLASEAFWVVKKLRLYFTEKLHFLHSMPCTCCCTDEMGTVCFARNESIPQLVSHRRINDMIPPAALIVYYLLYVCMLLKSVPKWTRTDACMQVDRLNNHNNWYNLAHSQ